MDQSEHYYQLVLMGREPFLRKSAPAALVRRRGGTSDEPMPLEGEETDTLVASMDGALASAVAASGNLRVYPLAKKQGAPFADMITIGRTGNNDVVIDDVTVSRFHAFLRQRGSTWYVCDSGSKNGTKLEGEKLTPRKERPIHSGQVVRLGDVDLTFYTSDHLFDVMSGSHR